MRSSKPWFKIDESGVLWGMKLLVGIYRLFGRWLFAVLLHPVIAYYLLTNRVAREASRDYLRRLNETDQNCRVQPTYRNIYRHFLNFAQSILDRISAWTGILTLDDLIFEQRENLTDPIHAGQGLLLIGSHMGCLEVSRAFAGLKEDVRLNVLIHSKNAARMNQLLKQVNMDHQLELIEVTEINPGTAIKLNEKISNGEVVVIVGDRVPVTGHGATVSAQFLGSMAEFPQGPWILAHLLKCPVLTLFCIKLEGKYHIHCEPFARSIHLPRARRVENMRREVQRYARRLEHYCKLAPLQWYNFYPFWRTPSKTLSQTSSQTCSSRGQR
jgi:predicted LPLAT superfamily acyltransferase